MLKIEVKTRKSPGQVIKEAASFFVGRYGLEVKDRAKCCAEFVGAGGGVEINAFTEGGETIVVLLFHEWDDQVKEFARAFAR